MFAEEDNSAFLVMASMMCPAALILNVAALAAMLHYPDKPKPHFYLIANLIVTDLLVAVVGTTIMWVSFWVVGQ